MFFSIFTYLLACLNPEVETLIRLAACPTVAPSQFVPQIECSRLSEYRLFTKPDCLPVKDRRFGSPLKVLFP